MKIVIVGGTGLVGSKLVARLREHGHDVVPASPANGVNTLTGVGLADALVGAAVVVDVSNSPKLDDASALNFFATSTANLLAAELPAGVGHHIVLSVVGSERLTEDVARALASVCVAPPVNGDVEVAGPEQFRLDDLIRRKLSVRGDPLCRMARSPRSDARANASLPLGRVRNLRAGRLPRISDPYLGPTTR